MTRREADLMEALEIRIADEELRVAAAVVRKVREAFQSQRWSDLIRKHGKERVRPGSSWPT
jgi:hypothetical protein